MLSALIVVISFVPNAISGEVPSAAPMAAPVAANDEGLEASAQRELREMLSVESLKADLEEESAAVTNGLLTNTRYSTNDSNVNRSPAVLGPPTENPVDFSAGNSVED